MALTRKTKGGGTLINQIIHGDCLEVMPQIPAGSVDMILCDLPYGTTQNEWDSVIPLEKLWTEYKRVIKHDGAIVLTAQCPFDKVLGASNMQMLRYEWIWEKQKATGFLNARRMPLKAHENILVFYDKLPTYNPQMVKGQPYNKGVRKQGNGNGTYGDFNAAPIINETGDRFPRSVIQFQTADSKVPEIDHPTQKPANLFRYLIETYTIPGELVLDNCIGSGTTAEAALSCGRNFIGIEKEFKYVEVARERLQFVQPVLNF